MENDNKRKTTIINLFCGPGGGKSTNAAYLFYLLKTDGENAELVREYVKDWAWQQRKISTYDQIYFLGKQTHCESMLYGKVDWIVTDSPVMMNLYYAAKYCTLSLSEGVRAATLSFYQQAAEDGYKHVHVFLKRNKPYSNEGRYQTESEAIEIDNEIRNLLKSLKVPIIECATDEADLRKVLNKIKGEVK